MQEMSSIRRQEKKRHDLIKKSLKLLVRKNAVVVCVMNSDGRFFLYLKVCCFFNHEVTRSFLLLHKLLVKYDRVNRRGNWHKDKGKFGAYFSVTGESLKLLLLLRYDLKVFLI
jgi:nitrite reductase/ring-hydroxylating ferredoxin subunit